MAVNKIIYGGNTLVDLTGDTVTAADLADGVKATGADGKPIVGLMKKVTIDAELSTTSTNPVQNKVIYNALLGKVGTDIFSGFALLGGATNIRWREGTQFIGSINAVNYTGTARAATHDGEGNVITETYAKKGDVPTKLSQLENDAAYVKKGADIWVERYYTYIRSATSDAPQVHVAQYNTSTGSFVLDLGYFTSDITGGQSLVFTAYIQSTSDTAGTLTINNAGTIKHVGAASDLAITKAGLLLNVLMTRDWNGVVTSIIQASKLEGGA